METKIIVIGDPHFKTNNVEECNLMCSQIINWIEKTKPHAVVCLGDILDRHETIHVGPLLRSISFFEKIAEKYSLFILIGNHDRPNNQIFMTDEHPFTALKLWKNTKIVDTTMTEEINNMKFVFVPYVPPGRFSDALKNTNITNTYAIFAHQEFCGCKMGAVESVVGDKWEPNQPLVVSGHIHDFDVLQPNIIYTGTPIQHAYGDREDKGIFLFHFSRETKFRYERLELDIPKKKIVKVSVSEIEMLKKLDPKCHYKIIVSGTPQELRSLKLSSYLQKISKYKIAYKTISTLGTSVIEENIQQKDFLESLFDEIKECTNDIQEKSDLIYCFQELFGQIQKPNIVIS